MDALDGEPRAAAPALRVEGLENVPQEGPVLLCPNHSSAIDPILLVIALGRRYPIRIMAKQQLLKIPVLGAILRGIGVFPVDRGNSDIGAVKTAIRSLKDGWNLLLFPEGTRVREPGTVAVKGGAAMIAIRSGVQMLIFLAGLQSISPAIYESCYMEGASAWETFWKITFPMISPMILVNTIYTIIDSFTSADNAVMQTIQTVYNSSGRMTESVAMSWIYFLIVVLILAVIAGLLSAFVFYQRRD